MKIFKAPLESRQKLLTIIATVMWCWWCNERVVVQKGERLSEQPRLREFVLCQTCTWNAIRTVIFLLNFSPFLRKRNGKKKTRRWSRNEMQQIPRSNNNDDDEATSRVCRGAQSAEQRCEIYLTISEQWAGKTRQKREHKEAKRATISSSMMIYAWNWRKKGFLVENFLTF